jgi:hypothetical protein
MYAYNSMVSSAVYLHLSIRHVRSLFHAVVGRLSLSQSSPCTLIISWYRRPSIFISVFAIHAHNFTLSSAVFLYLSLRRVRL